MPAGLQVFDESAAIVDDITTKFSRIVGYYDIPLVDPETVTTHSGSFFVAEFSTGSPFIFYTISSTDATLNTYGIRFFPDVSISGNTVTWTYRMLSTEEQRVQVKEAFGKIGGIRLTYGVYA